MKFDFSYAWQDEDPEVRLKSHQATIADLRIAVDERVFTFNEPLHCDENGGESKSFITVSVFPLAEFVAANWWALLHEPLEKEKLLKDTQPFKSRHWINRHTDGFAYPTLGFFGADTSIRISARASHIESANIQFPITSNTTDKWDGIERSEVELALLTFLETTAARLPRSQDSEWLNDMVTRIIHSRSDNEEESYCRYAGLLGADPYDPSDDLEKAITETVSILGEGIAMELFATAEMYDVAQKASWIDDTTSKNIKKSIEVAKHVHDLKDAIGRNTQSEDKPWDRGYSAARQLRSVLGFKQDHTFGTLDDVTKALFDAPSRVASNLKNLESACGSRGIACESEQGFGIAFDRGDRRNSQFQVVSTFSDFLFSEHDKLFLATRAPTDRQKCNRAFAAEFLAPISGIKEKLSPSKSLDSNLEGIAHDFGVSTFIIKYQLQNQAPEELERFAT